MLQVALPEGYVFTRSGGESVIGATGESTAVIDLGALAMGQTISGQMIGALKPASVGGVVWMDADDDGRRQVNDAGMQGLAVQLVSDESSFTAYTDETGAYRFDGVLPGSYTLSFELPQGHAFARNASGTRRLSCVPMTNALVPLLQACSIWMPVWSASVRSAALSGRTVNTTDVMTVTNPAWKAR